ncbi:NAD-dependent epimerase/dehydratase family protein [Burkholderia plantarii]|uniref:NAD-dependent epimerase/dehydratase n=1 Tax=Burkholderia plantarii TaxID=41899 RepID=A0A0B6RX94_BURPL|nr:NAD-dependent epimerase/dehydratase family protein [Burkholderia plantarii]AJK49972.1 NAD-dependent epimerase/dehydratase [Burkholderia plantarii]WLE63204.1 NAD-dependent epimerase/dehydratase family protein [Burkholderia plantarii]
MKILVTGGAGFIGTSLVRKLAAGNATVTVVDNLSEQIHGVDPYRDSELLRRLDGSVRLIEGSVCDRDTLERAMRGQDAIVHLAAETGTGQSMYEVGRYLDVNVGGCGLILDILVKNRGNSVRKVVVASSRAIYGEGKYRSPALGIVYPDAREETDLLAGRFDYHCAASGEPLECLPTDEESKIHPSSVYGITKYNQEQMVMTVCRAIGIGAVALRYQNVYGPGQSLSNPYTGILSIFSTRIKNGNGINVFEDGRQSRDFVYIDDVVDATEAALVRPEAGGRVFGIGSGQRTAVIDVARQLRLLYRSEAPVEVTGAFRLGDIRHNYADLTRAREWLGFEPKVRFEDGVARFAAWVDEQEVKADNYERSIVEMQARGLYQVGRVAA